MLSFWTELSKNQGPSGECTASTEDTDWSFDPPQIPGVYQMRLVLEGKQFGEISEVTVLANQNFKRFDTVQWRPAPERNVCQ